MSILKNAVGSIQVGVEDFDENDPSRLISSLRNVYAGLLLLYKEKLVRLSPADDPTLLIRSKLLQYRENGEIKFAAKNKEPVSRTVDYIGIFDRFESLGVVIDKKSRKSLDEIQKMRNDIEHYYSEKPITVYREVLVKSFILIKDFIVDHLNEDPRELLGDACWETLIDEKQIYESLKKDCCASIEHADWRYKTVKYSLTELRCPKCSSELVKVVAGSHAYPSIDLICAACSHSFSFSEVLSECVTEYMSILAHVNYMDGGEDLSDNCPSCGEPTFIFNEGCCVSCDYELRFPECGHCHVPLRADDQYYGGLCSYHAHLRDRDD